MSFSLPFPSPGGGSNLGKDSSVPPTSSFGGNYGPLHDPQSNMKIDIPSEKEDSTRTVSAKKPTQQQQQQQHHQHPNHTQQYHHPQQHHSPAHHSNLAVHSPLQATTTASSAPHHDSVGLHSKGSHFYATVSAAPPPHWHHHPRQPHSNADSYFPHSAGAYGHNHTAPLTSSYSQPDSKTPSVNRAHSRQASLGGQPSSAIVSTRHKKPVDMSLSLSSGGEARGATQGQADFANFAGANHAGPPSPSTLTDMILSLHSTLYGGKRTPEEVRERVAAFYDNDAVFESPLLSARGRDQIADQFIMAFTLPGMDVASELRDVICSDFEFDGTRAGIIDQTISVSFFPSLFGSQSYPTSSSQTHHPSHAPSSSQRAGTSTPGYTLQSAGVTPHPFANYSQAHTPAGGLGSMFSRFTSSRPHSPTTPYSASSLWASSRPHTPGAHSSHIRPLSTSHRPSTPPSVNGEDEDAEYGGRSTIRGSHFDDSSHFVSSTEAGGGQMTRPQMPVDSITPHWSADGLGRSSVRALLWGILHPRAVLKSLCTIHLRVMSRLEFNDAGHIVRHEDTWGLRETIEGTIPFASLVYALERRVVGYLCSFAVGKGFQLSSALSRSISGRRNSDSFQQKPRPLLERDGKYDPDASEAARALLLGQHQHRQEQLHMMARSRASSPSRRFSSHGHATPYSHTVGTRSRARSLIGQQNYSQPSRAASTDNLLAMSSTLTGYGERERGSTTAGGIESLPPDSSARYRDRGTRRPTSSTVSAPVTTGGTSIASDSFWQPGEGSSQNPEGLDSKSRAPDRDL